MTSPRGFPTGFEYQEAVQHPERCFSDPDLRSASFERMAMGLPKMISGNFASVFPMTSVSGRQYAVKCFTREASHQLQRYKSIGAYLNKLKPWWATDFQFIPDGILVDASWYPILRMNWVSGLTLTRWISDNFNQPAAVANLARRFDEMIRDLAAARMAHGDLQSGNLLIADSGALHLVDYDGMYVPGLDKLPADEVGHPDYQPPGRSRSDYGPAMDRFSAWLISLSLKILAIDPGLWDKLNPTHDEFLLLNRNDLLDLKSSARFSVLSSHRETEVRRLARIARDILPLPMAAVPALVVPAPADAPAPAVAPKAAASGIPSWMRSYISESAGAQGQASTASPAAPEQQDHRILARWLTWLMRALAVLSAVAAAGVAWDWRIGLVVCGSASFLVTVSLWSLYRRDPFTRTFIEMRQTRRRAISGVNRASGGIAQIEKESASLERTVQRLTIQHGKKRASVQADFDRRQQRASRELISIDRKLAQLDNRRQREIDRRLKQFRQAYVKTRLSQAVIGVNEIPGVGVQLVARLRSAGIRSAADFSRIEYINSRTSGIVYFWLASGARVYIPGIGGVKARRIDQWRQTQFANAVRHQPSALPASELHAIDAQFAVEEQQLREERARSAGQIADQIAAIQRECRAALDDIDKDHQAQLLPIDERKAELAGQLGQAHARHLAAQQQVLDWDVRLAAVRQPAFGRFVRTVLKR